MNNSIDIPNTKITENLTKPNIKEYIKYVGSLILKILQHEDGFELASCIESKINYILRSIQVSTLTCAVKGTDEYTNIQSLFNLLTQIAADLKLVIDHDLIDYVIIKYFEKKIASERIHTFKMLIKSDLLGHKIDEMHAERIIRLILGYKD